MRVRSLGTGVNVARYWSFPAGWQTRVRGSPTSGASVRTTLSPSGSFPEDQGAIALMVQVTGRDRSEYDRGGTSTWSPGRSSRSVSRPTGIA